jgi:hypothetical protein
VRVDLEVVLGVKEVEEDDEDFFNFELIGYV